MSKPGLSDLTYYYPEIAEYAADHSSALSSNETHDILEALKAETGDAGFMTFMLISPHQAKLMTELLCITGARRVLEIGTLTGYSAIAMGSVLPVDGKLVTLEIVPEAHAIASRYVKIARLEDKVELRLGPAADSIQQIIKEDPSTQFDFIFIDADKDNYSRYIDMILDNNLLADKGIIVADNVLRGGDVVQFARNSKEKAPGSSEIHIDRYAKHLHAFNVKLQEDPRIHVTVLPIFDGMSIIRKK